MLSEKQLKTARRVLWPLLILIMALIFFFSAQSGEDSGNTSGFITQMILRVIRPDFDSLPEDAQMRLLDTVHLIVRKGAHFSEFAALAFVMYLLLRTYPLKMFGLFSWLGATLYAVTDEIHQLFVGERAGSIKDVMIDSCGAAAGVLVAFVLVYWKLKRLSKRNPEGL